MLTDFDRIKREARAYAIERNQTGEPVSLRDFCRRLGFNQQWLNGGHNRPSEKARNIVLKEWGAIDVKAHAGLKKSIAVASGQEIDETRDWEILDDQWPHHTELTRILATAGRREMFEHLRNNYDRATAMRYASVCDNRGNKGATFERTKGGREVADAVV